MTKQVIKLDNDNMKINRRIMALCLSLSVLFAFLPIIATFAENETISNQQVLQIRNNCNSVKNTLNQLHSSDALLRVNMGQMYESTLTKMMNRFNGRVESSGFGIADLSEISSKYGLALDNFRSDYKIYEEQLSLAISIDCSKQPTVFYDAVALARIERKQVYADVLKLNDYINQYQLALNQFGEFYQSNQKENITE